jgi:hypothetical protein
VDGKFERKYLVCDSLPIGQDPAFEVAAQITFHIRRNRIPLGIGLPLVSEPGLQVLLDGLVGDRALGAPSLV